MISWNENVFCFKSYNSTFFRLRNVTLEIFVLWSKNFNYKKSLQDYFSFCHVNKLRAVQSLSLYENNLPYNPQTVLLLLAKKYPCRWWALSWTFSLFCRWPVSRRRTRSSRRWRSLMFFWSWFRWSWCRPRWRHPSCRSWTWRGSPWKQKCHT